MKLLKHFNKIVGTFACIGFVLIMLTYHTSKLEHINGDEKLTIRVNTFRRLDLLVQFLDHYSTCNSVEEIQVVWSDQKNQAPVDWLDNYPKDKVHFEIHDKDSLNNRFKALKPVPTHAVLSVDDDVVLPCGDMDSLLRVWASNRKSIVGTSPRMHGYDPSTGSMRYFKWQHTWWSGLYSIMLTKVAIFHKDYLEEYWKAIPEEFLTYVDDNRNCEDLAMAHTIAASSHVPPVWASGSAYEIGQSGISSIGGHFSERGKCLEMLEKVTGKYPWVTATQKAVKLGFAPSDFMSLFYDWK